MQTGTRLGRWSVFVLLVGLVRPLPAVEVEWAIDEEPRLEQVEEVFSFSPKLVPLWLEALRRPEADLKRQAADAMATAYQRGLRDVQPAVTPLANELKAKQLPSAARLAIARALVVIDAREAADVLRGQVEQGSLDLAQIVEPALARWDDSPMRDVWLARLTEPATAHARQILAIECLAMVQEPRAVKPLRRMALEDSTPPSLRLSAARALGQLQNTGLLSDAERLASDSAPQRMLDRLVAASLLVRHEGAETEKLLLQLAVDPEPAVAAIALARLLAFDPHLTTPIMAQLVASPDSKVRRLAAEFLLKQQTPAAVEQLSELLDDPHPGVRVYAREALLTLAEQPELDSPVREAGMKMVASDRLRGVEQALVLLGALDHEPVAPRAVELLKAESPPIFITAAWTLRKLAVPETAPAIFQRVKSETEASLARGAKLERIEDQKFIDLCRQLHHLIEALGTTQHAAAESLLVQYFPKPPLIEDPALTPQVTTREADLRAAALWSLGQIHRDRATPEVTQPLMERLTDEDQANPESERVRQASAVALAVMRAEGAIPALQEYYHVDDRQLPFPRTCGWALSQFTGEELPPLEPRVVRQSGWFLEPLDP